MSQENVELVQRMWELVAEGFDAGNPVNAFDAAFDQGLIAPTATFTPALEVPGAETYVGREGFAEFLRTWTADFVDWKIWPEKIIDAGDDNVVVVTRQCATGRGSGATVELTFASVNTIRDGQIVDRRHYLDADEALDAVGLSE
jgi:ketosteroid isomerase-like protein